MKRRKIGETILVGLAVIVFFATISRGASFGPKAQVQDAKKEVSKTIELTGVLENVSEGKHDLNVEILDNDELLFSMEFKGVEINDGFYALAINLKEAGLEVGRSYELKITVLGEEEIPVTQARLEIVPGLTVRAFEEESRGVAAGLYNITGNYPYPDAVVTVTNKGTGYGIKSVSQKGVGLHAESNALAGYGLYAKNTAGGTALKAEGNADITGDLTVGGQTSLTLPADSVGSSQIVNGSIKNEDIAAGLNADTLDGKNSTEFISTEGDGSINGRLSVKGLDASGSTGTYLGRFTNLATDGGGLQIHAGSPSLPALEIQNFDEHKNLLVVEGEGNIGVGVNPPAYKLDVAGQMNATEYLQNGLPFTALWKTVPETSDIYYNLGNVGIGTMEPIDPGLGWTDLTITGSNGGILSFVVNGAEVGRMFAGSGKTLVSAYNNNALAFQTDGHDRLTINTAGNVGIGTATPGYKLTVKSNSGIKLEDSGGIYAAGVDLELYVDGNKNFRFLDSSGGDKVIIQERSGNVGIGTTGPSGKLSINSGNDLGSVHFFDSLYPDMAFDGGSDSYWRFWNTGATDGATFFRSNAADPIVYMKNDGNVGIGTTTPGYKLTVKSNSGIKLEDSGGVYAAGVDLELYVDGNKNFRFLDSSGGDKVIIQGGSGNVGIGTNQPDAPLTISGPNRAYFDLNETKTNSKWRWVVNDNTGALTLEDRSSGVVVLNIAKGTSGVAVKELIVTENPAMPDFVFADDYKLRPLQEVETYIREKKHLPEIPSAREVETNGLNVSQMQTKLLQKVEELTLYVIDLKKENALMKEEIRALRR